jgi:hypothetical protein
VGLLLKVLPCETVQLYVQLSYKCCISAGGAGGGHQVRPVPLHPGGQGQECARFITHSHGLHQGEDHALFVSHIVADYIKVRTMLLSNYKLSWTTSR